MEYARCHDLFWPPPIRGGIFVPVVLGFSLLVILISSCLFDCSDGEFDVTQLEQLVKRNFLNQFFAKNQKLVADVSGYNLQFTILKVDVLDLEGLTAAAAAGPGKKKPAKKPETDTTPGEDGEEGTRESTLDLSVQQLLTRFFPSCSWRGAWCLDGSHFYFLGEGPERHSEACWS
jgi:ribosomal protein L12E/L44/L45/RPP1/RPP2